MIEYTVMSVILLFLAAKKKPVFGQMTLTGDLAVDWVKQGVETVIQASKIEFGSPTAYAEDFNIPDYHLDKKVVALIWPVNSWSNPLLVTQQSILKPLEAQCVAWEAAGATATTHKYHGTTIGRIEFEEQHPIISISKDKKLPRHAPYEVKID